jgi:hypothetical protein
MKKQQVKKGKSVEGGEEPQKERRKCSKIDDEQHFFIDCSKTFQIKITLLKKFIQVLLKNS